MKQSSHIDNESDSPILFASISESYAEAFNIIWKERFEDTNEFHWDRSLLLQPMSQLLGVAIETALKGLITCRNLKLLKTHNLLKLQKSLDDNCLNERLDRNLADLPVPREILDINPDTKVEELEATYRTNRFHLESLDRLYDRPFVSRYPVLGAHSLPDPVALSTISKVLREQLHIEKRQWIPRANS